MQLFSQQIYIVLGPVVETKNRTMTKAGKNQLSGADVLVGEADEKHKYVTDGAINYTKNNQAG